MRDMEMEPQVQIQENVKEKQLGSIQKSAPILKVYKDLKNDRKFIDYSAASSLGFISYEVYKSNPKGYYIISEKQLMWILEQGIEIKYIEFGKEREIEKERERIKKLNVDYLNTNSKNDIDVAGFEKSNDVIIEELKEFRNEIINQYSSDYDNFNPKKL